MKRGSRQVVGGLGILVFLTAYIAIAVILADRLPANRAVQLVYFVVVGIGWGVPLLPMMSWMENGRFEFRKRLR